MRQQQPDVLVFEPEACTSAISRFLEAARSAAPSLRAVAVSTVDDPGAIRATLQSGAWAYVLKDAHPQDIAVAVRQALSHSIYLAHTVDLGDTANTTAAPQSNGTGLSVLTRREREILALATEGKSNAAMARELWVTEQTVKFHLSNIYRKLGVAKPHRGQPLGTRTRHRNSGASPRRPDARLAEPLTTVRCAALQEGRSPTGNGRDEKRARWEKRVQWSSRSLVSGLLVVAGTGSWPPSLFPQPPWEERHARARISACP